MARAVGEVVRLVIGFLPSSGAALEGSRTGALLRAAGEAAVTRKGRSVRSGGLVP